LACAKWVIFFVFDSLRFLNSPERRRRTHRERVPESLFAATRYEFNYGVKHWRTCCASAWLAERLRHILTSLRFVPVFLGNFFRELGFGIFQERIKANRPNSDRRVRLQRGCWGKVR